MAYHIERNTVQETLVIPLYGRARCAARFPQLYRDETAVRLMLKTWIKDADIQDVGAYFSVRDAKTELSSFAPGLTISSRGYMLGYHDLKLPCVPPLYRFLSRVGDTCMRMQIVRLTFPDAR